MRLDKIFKNILLVLMACIVLTACATKKEIKTETTTTATSTTEAKTEKTEEKADPIEPIAAQMQGDVYTGTDTVGYLAEGVKDRVFFATNESILTTASRETLRAQAAWLRKNPGINVVLEGHADERGTREYNLALSERRAKAIEDFLVATGVSSFNIEVVGYGEESPVDVASNETAWAKNRRAEVFFIR